MSRIPAYLEKHLPDNSYVLLYPVQAGGGEEKMYLA